MQRTLKNALCIVFFTLVTFICNISTYSAQVTLTWGPNTESDLAGYELHYGIATATYDNSIDVGNVTNYTATNLVDGETYFFAVTAYDTSLNESDYSLEVSYTLPNTAATRTTTLPTTTTTTILPSTITVSSSIITGSDDVEERQDGSMYFKSSDIELVEDGAKNQTYSS